MKKLLVLATLLGLTCPACAHSFDHFYLEVSGSLSKPLNQSFEDQEILTHFKANRAIKVAMGRQIQHGWRTEISIDNVNNSSKLSPHFADNDVLDFEFLAREKLTSLLFNVYYDVPLGSRCFALIGTGIGPARLKIYSNFIYKQMAEVDTFASAVIAHHGSVGFGFKVTQQLWFMSTYRHLASTPLKSRLLLDETTSIQKPHHRSDTGYLELIYFF